MEHAISVDVVDDIKSIAKQLEDHYGDVPLSALSRCAAINKASIELRKGAQEAVKEIAKRTMPRLKKPMDAGHLLWRAADKGDAEAQYLRHNYFNHPAFDFLFYPAAGNSLVIVVEPTIVDDDRCAGADDLPL